jgi:hypothetical protein
MSKLNTQFVSAFTGILMAFVIALPASAQIPAIADTQAVHAKGVGILPPPLLPGVPLPGPAPDTDLYTTYSFYGPEYISWVVCGSTSQSEGCYDSGNLGPFGHSGAIIESSEAVSGNTVTRNVYVVDDASGGGTGVTLYVYQKTDVVTSSFDTTTITLTNTVPLPLAGGANVVTYMAANSGYLFIGTNLSQEAVRVQKTGLSTASIGGFSPSLNVSSITANKYGYVTVNFGSAGNPGGFYAFGPNGSAVEDGGGNDNVVDTTNAISIANLAANGGSENSASRMQIRSKKPILQGAAGH